jgi:hypothetical protein
MEPSRLSLIPAYQDKPRRQDALLTLFSAMLSDSLASRRTLRVGEPPGPRP